MGLTPDGYEVASGAEVFEDFATALNDNEPAANPRAESTYTYALLFAMAATIAREREQDLQDVYRSAYVEDATGQALTKKARNLGVQRKDATKATGVVKFFRSSSPSSDITIPSGTRVETASTDPVAFVTTEATTITTSETSALANIEAVTGGSDGNVGANTIVAIPSPPATVEVTNPDPTGDPSVRDTNGDPLIVGRDRESDDELRNRVLDTDATDEGPSANGIELALDDVDGVVDAHMNVNATNSTVGGLDPYSSEVVVYGGDAYDIASTLTDVMSVTTVLRLQGGVNGTSDSATVYEPLLDQQVTVPFSRPTFVTAAVTIDVVHTSAYAGDGTVRDEIVEYVGGTRVDDSTVVGLGPGNNVLVNEIENRVEDLDGVDYADVTLLDTNGDSTDDTTTDSDGVPVLAIGSSEVARFDADSITVTTTAR